MNEPKDRSCATTVCPIHDDTHYCKFKIRDVCRCVCTCCTKEAAEWENRIWQWATNAFPVEHRRPDKIIELIAAIHQLLKETQNKTREEILAALPRLPQPEIKPREFKTYEDGLRAGAYAIVSDIRDTITNQNKSV